jgi:hypothetical protein
MAAMAGRSRVGSPVWSAYCAAVARTASSASPVDSSSSKARSPNPAG